MLPSDRPIDCQTDTPVDESTHRKAIKGPLQTSTGSLSKQNITKQQNQNQTTPSKSNLKPNNNFQHISNSKQSTPGKTTQISNFQTTTTKLEAAPHTGSGTDTI